MAKLNKNEGFAKNSILNFAKIVNDEQSYNKFINSAETVFNAYDFTEEAKEEVKEKCFKIISKKNIFEEDLMSRLNNDFANFRVVSGEQIYMTLPEEEVKGIKSFLTKKRAVAGGIILTAGIVGLTAFNMKKQNDSKNASSATAVTAESNIDVTPDITPEATPVPTANVNNDELNPLLSFNPEDSEVLVDNIIKLFKDSIPKGHKVTKENLIQETANWTDARQTANIENIGPDFLLKFYQTDSKDPLSMLENYLRVVSQVNSDAQVSEDSWDLNPMFANKSDAELVAKFQKLVRQIVSATKDKNKASVRKNSVALRKELEKLVYSNGSRQYSNSAIVMAINLSFSGANVAKVNGMADVVIPSDLRRVVYTDGAVKCIEATRAGKGTFEENIKEYGGKDNVYMKAILGLFEELERDLNQVIVIYSTMDEETRKISFSDKMSYNASQAIIIEGLDKLLDTFKRDKSYKDTYYPEIKVTVLNKEKVKTTKKITKSKTAKKITKKKKAGKKITAKDISSKDFKKGTITSKDGKTTVTAKTKKDFNENADAYQAGFDSGFEFGRSQGEKGKPKSFGTISVPSKYADDPNEEKSYRAGWLSGANDGYANGIKIYNANKDYKQEVVTGSKTEESDVYGNENVNAGKSSSSSSSSSSSNDSSSSSSSKTEESDVYDVEDMPIESNSVNKSNSTKSVNDRINSLKKLRNSIANLKVEQPYEQENSRVK